MRIYYDIIPIVETLFSVPHLEYMVINRLYILYIYIFSMRNSLTYKIQVVCYSVHQCVRFKGKYGP